jgi:hypothetical protein
VEIGAVRERIALDTDSCRRLAAATLEEEGDQHCPVLACRHQVIGLERPPTAASLSHPRLRLIPPTPGLAAGVARYRLAPKTSPPA